MRKKCPHCRTNLEIDLRRNPSWITCADCGYDYSVLELERLTDRIETLQKWTDFDIGGHLGSGEFADVFAASHRDTGKSVALKVPRDESLAQRTFLLREHRVAKHLRHANIISADRLVQNPITFLVCDLVHGTPMDRWTGRDKLDQFQAAAMCATLASAIHYTHENGVIHRDLKPSNILIDPQGQPCITDFGMARCEFDDQMISSERHQQALQLVTLKRRSAKGVAKMGTPAYMSPEQARGEQATCSSDIYSLGVILYELLTGSRPFQGDGKSVMRQVVRQRPPSPRRLAPQISPKIEAICVKAMSKRPERRHQSAAEFAEDCRRFANSRSDSEADIGYSRELVSSWLKGHPAEAIALVFLVTSSAVLLLWLSKP